MLADTNASQESNGEQDTVSESKSAVMLPDKNPDTSQESDAVS
jgi:hypothetical protein